MGEPTYIISSVDLVTEVCDERRFCKKIDTFLRQLRHGVRDGLFTAHNDEHNWGVAHRALMPAFGPLPIQAMYDEMYDIASQLVSKWARDGADQEINVTNDMTRLTLDSIGLCAMDYRFNSFYHEEVHEFIRAMGDVLLESGKRAMRSKIEAWLNPSAEKKFFADIAVMKKIAQECIDRRRAGPQKKDLLDAMLNGKDPKTGEKLSNENIINNMITFLVAGHETTSGMLSFTLFYLLKNPKTLQRAQQEVDSVVGSSPIQFKHIKELKYIEAALREALRLCPTTVGFSVSPVPGTQGPVTLAGKYVLPPEAVIMILGTRSGRDPKIFGEDATEFKPERMYDEYFNKLPPGAWKPFGNGTRGCIGRPFAWQEAILALGIILQNFNLRFADPSYELKIAETLTIKPDNLLIKAQLRDGIDPIQLSKKLHGEIRPAARKDSAKDVGASKSSGDAGGLTIFFGSSAGTCEGLAQSLAASARARSFDTVVDSLDAAVDKFPKDHPVVIIACTYEGQPPDNANIFAEWLKTADRSKFEGAQVTIFGCGHRDWVSTYQKMPRTIEEELSRKGAKVLAQRGETDTSQGTILDDFDSWMDKLWPSISSGVEESGSTSSLEVRLSTNSRASHLHHKVRDARVVSNQRITSPDAPEKRHITISLPRDMQYDAGDYLAVLPLNSQQLVSRVLRRFSLPWDTAMAITSGSHATIPENQELPIALILSGYIELGARASRKSRDILSELSNLSLADENGSILDILERHPDINVPFGTFLELHMPLRLRQYSISSSPLANSSLATITFSVIESDEHIGTATSYLKSLEPGSTVQVAVKKSSAAFHLPLDESIPVIMIAAGAGLAPFRGFLQERAAKAEAGRQLGEALLFVECRHPKQDKLFAEELGQWERLGVVKVVYAYSRASEESEGCRYVQDRVYKEADEIARLFDLGARIYICGSGAMGRNVSDVAVRLLVEEAEEKGETLSEEEARASWEKWRGERYALDVFD
ncbi:Bifunctional cytochrome P450/NADPH--P450 reductase [Pseudocercospora fuligena]|uniref:Bifunctional cytochrome P450/NADPH--P450 reductase n=1 Tax=Pseudocercospora fuligena TaxID=685502 RepID=A0A8H6VE04_9PEZI|nr:Bifunctional cytochrome P450/NADPH--P450 reductase [Pseudocercospora fuligena]